MSSPHSSSTLASDNPKNKLINFINYNVIFGVGIEPKLWVLKVINKITDKGLLDSIPNCVDTITNG